MKANFEGKELRLAMLGLVEGNGHPYSWSAIFNGYDCEAMAQCRYAGIPAYLDKQPAHTFGIPGARVTHLWTDNPADAAHIAKSSLIPHIVSTPEAVIGEVDGVLVATDIGSEHVERCRPFVEAGIPTFVDKPLVDNETDLQTFCQWVKEGAAILSSSCMRYAKEFVPYRTSTHNLGELRFACVTAPKSWERYGIHALEGIYPILGPGFVSARHSGTAGRDVVHFKHRDGIDIVAVASQDMYGGFGTLQLCGTAGQAQAMFSDTYYAFKTQLKEYVSFLHTDTRPFPFAETVELMQMVIATIRSREEGGREVALDEIVAVAR